MQYKPSVVASPHPQQPVIVESLRNLLAHVRVLIVALGGTFALQAQTCDPIPQPGGESISAQITINGTGIPVTDGMVVPAWTPLRIDSIATATGSCVKRAWTNTQPSSCETTGTVWERHSNHTDFSRDLGGWRRGGP